MKNKAPIIIVVIGAVIAALIVIVAAVMQSQANAEAEQAAAEAAAAEAAAAEAAAQEQAEAQAAAEAAAAAAEQERIAAEQAAAARISRLTGSYMCYGAGAFRDAPTTVTIDGDEIIADGPLFASGSGLGNSLGDQPWIFQLTPNTAYSFGDEMVHEITKADFTARYTGTQYVSMRFDIEDGVVTRVHAGA